MPSRARYGDYRCARCIHRSPGGQARLARYNQGAARKAINKQHNDRRILIGREYHSMAHSAAEAQRINAHIKERTRELVTRLKNRKEAQGASAR